MNATESPVDGVDYGAEFQELLEASLSYAPPRRARFATPRFLEIDEREIIVDRAPSGDGIVPHQDIERLDPNFRASLEVGQEVPVYVMNPRDQDENLIVSINMACNSTTGRRRAACSATETVVDVTVVGHTAAASWCAGTGWRASSPGSHLVSVSYSGDRREAWEGLRDKQLGVKVIEVDQDRRRLIFSEREAQREWRARQKARLLEELKEGDRVPGQVTGLRDFGAFVNLGGADGLIHVSELAWHRVDHPRTCCASASKSRSTCSTSTTNATASPSAASACSATPGTTPPSVTTRAAGGRHGDNGVIRRLRGPQRRP